MRRTIERHLSYLEREHGVRVLYAVESGSRAWGFASQDSDYDVRFIYAHQTDDYLRLHAPTETLTAHEGVHDLDFHGWDIKKFLGLLRKSNPSAIEWLNADPDATYIPLHPALASLREAVFAQHMWSRLALINHYYGLAQGEYERYLGAHLDRGEPVEAKKYLYVIRPLVVLHWLDQQDSVPTNDFVALVDQDWTWPSFAVRDAILRTIADKRRGSERMVYTPDKWLTGFMDAQLADWHARRPHLKESPEARVRDIEPLLEAALYDITHERRTVALPAIKLGQVTTVTLS